LDDIFNISQRESDLKLLFHQIAIKLASDVIRDMISFRLNLELKPQDFSIGKVLKGQEYFDYEDYRYKVKEASNCILKNKFNSVSKEIHDSLTNSLSKVEINKAIEDSENEVSHALETDDWLNLFPGKELLELAGKELGISNTISLQNSIIKEFASNRDRIDHELVTIFNKINSE